MPISKTDANSGTLLGRYKALRRAWRDRKAAKAVAKYLEDAERRERIQEFVNRTRGGDRTGRQNLGFSPGYTKAKKIADAEAHTAGLLRKEYND